MANQLREFIQSIVNAIGRKKQIPSGYMNAQSIPSEIDTIVTSEEAEELIKKLCSSIKTSADIVLPYGIENLRPYTLYVYPRTTNTTINFTIPVSVSNWPDATSHVIKGNGQYAKYVNLNIYFTGTIQQWLSISRYGSGSSSSSYAGLSDIPWTLYINNTEIKEIVTGNITIQPNTFTYQKLDKLTISSNAILNAHLTCNATIGHIVFEEGRASLDTSYCFSELNKSTDTNVFCKITLPTTLKTIGRTTFYNAKIDSINFPEGLTTIGQEVFKNTYFKNTVIELPSTITSIGRGAFDCNTKATYIVKATTPPTIGSDTFNTSRINKIYVPKSENQVILNAYKTATNWSKFANYIYEPNTITFSIDGSLLNNENALYSIDGGVEQQFTQASFTGENLSTLTVTSKSANVVIKVGTTQGGSEIGTVANASTTFTFEADTTIYITKQ